MEKTSRTAKRNRVLQARIGIVKRGKFTFLKRPEKYYLPMVDISLTGAQFLSAQGMPIGSKVDIEIDAPAFEDNITAVGEVRWCKTHMGKKVAYRVGVKFVSFKKNAKQKIAQLAANQTLRLVRRKAESKG